MSLNRQLIPLLLLLSLMAYGEMTPQPCKHPAVAEDNLSKTFRYGCFCGENYPKLMHPSGKSYRKLNTKERQELIAQYQAIEPYDDIDKVCQTHDICYIQEGKKARSCNQALYHSLNEMEETFQAHAETNITSAECQHLAFDIGSVFNTIFAPSDDDDTIFDLGMLMVNGGITAGNKVLQESADTLSDSDTPRYPPAGIKCLQEKFKQGKHKTIQPPTTVKIRTIQRN